MQPFYRIPYFLILGLLVLSCSQVSVRTTNPVLEPSEKQSPTGVKTLFFLGSSATYGHASNGVSMAEFLSEKMGCRTIKDAISGTVLIDNGNDSYVARLKNWNSKIPVDVFICQLSTNDTRIYGLQRLGTISPSKNINDFDTQTTLGSLEYIIAYAKQQWNASVLLYTSNYFDNPDYEKLIEATYALQKKWNFRFLDLYHDTRFNTLTEEEKKHYLSDPVHPTRSGYEYWWTPKFEAVLLEMTQDKVK